MRPSQEIAVGCLAVRLRRLTRAVSALYDEALRPLGLKVSQLNVLVLADRLGVARPAQISGGLQMELSTVSRNLERMRKRGWLAVVEDPTDGRAQPVAVTEEGRRLIERALPAWRNAQRKAAAMLGQPLASDLGAMPATAEWETERPE